MKFLRNIFLLAIVIELLVIIVILRGEANPDGNIAVVEVSGPIDEALDTVLSLKKHEKRDDIKAIVLRVDSPGGTVGASQEIHDEVKRINQIKPVVVSMGDLAASGGYYISAPAQKIVANPGTITGSIGVIMSFPVVEEVLKKWNIRWEVIQAGENKNIASPFKSMTPEERQILENLTEDTHSQFITAVAQGRGLKLEVVRPLADGSVYSGSQAKKLGLVDELGSLEHAIRLAAKIAKIKDAKPIYPKEDVPMIEQIMGAKSNPFSLNEMAGQILPRFQWMPLH